MRINNFSNKDFRDYKEVIQSYRWRFLGLGKRKPCVIDSYDITIYHNNKRAVIIKGDATDYGMSCYAMFQDDFDDEYEFYLKKKSDMKEFSDFIINIFGIEYLNYIKKQINLNYYENIKK